MAAAHIAPTGIIVTGEVDEPTYGYGYQYAFDQRATETGPGHRRRPLGPQPGLAVRATGVHLGSEPGGAIERT